MKPHCPVCGYTKEDAAIHMDHHLCKGEIPGQRQGGRPLPELTIEQEIAELEAAGWKKVRRYTWKAPVGGYFLGPHGAWLAMKRRERQASK